MGRPGCLVVCLACLKLILKTYFIHVHTHRNLSLSLSEEYSMLLTHDESKILRGISTDFAWPLLLLISYLIPQHGIVPFPRLPSGIRGEILQILKN